MKIVLPLAIALMVANPLLAQTTYVDFQFNEATATQNNALVNASSGILGTTWSGVKFDTNGGWFAHNNYLNLGDTLYYVGTNPNVSTNSGNVFRSINFPTGGITSGDLIFEFAVPEWDMGGSDNKGTTGAGLSVRILKGLTGATEANNGVNLIFGVGAGPTLTPTIGDDIRSQTQTLGTGVNGYGFANGSVVAATALVNGTQYVIAGTGNSNWTGIGASTDTVGTVFTASGGATAGTTGTAAPTINATATANAKIYKIVVLGDTNWTSIGATGTPAVGTILTATGAGTGTGKVVEMTRFPQDSLGSLNLINTTSPTAVKIQLRVNVSSGVWSTRVKAGTGEWVPMVTDGTGLNALARIQVVTQSPITAPATVGTWQWASESPNVVGEYIKLDYLTLGTVDSFGKETASVTISNTSQVFDGQAKPVTVTTSPLSQATTVTYTGTGSTSYGPSTVAPTALGTYTVTAAIDASNATYQGTATDTLTIRNALAVNFAGSQIATQANNGTVNKPFSVITPQLVQTSIPTGKQIFGALKLDPLTPGTSSSAFLSFGTNGSGMKLQWNGTPPVYAEGDVATALFGFRRKDFTDGLGAKIVSFAAGTDLLSAKVVFDPKGTRLASGSFRFVVEDSGQFYISDAAPGYDSGNLGSSTLAVTVNALATNWYAFNPFSLAQLNPANFGTAVATPAFSNIQFIGTWVQATCGPNDGASTNLFPGIQVRGLTAEAVAGNAIATDTTGPVLTLIGGNVTLNEGDVYNDAGATALDAVDGLVGSTVTGAVVTNTSGQAVAGIYSLTYSAVDTSGNAAASTVSRTVTVNGPPKAVNFAASQILANSNIEYLDVPLSFATPVRANLALNYTGQSIYGALKIQPASGSLVVDAGAALSFGSNGGMKIQWNGPQGQSEVGRYAENDVATGIFMFRKQEFTEGFSAKQVSFTAEKDTLKATVVLAHKDSRLNSGRVRWVVKDSGNYYISDLVGAELVPTLPTGDNAAVELTSEALSLTWNSYNPWDLSSLNPASYTPVSLPAFNNIQALGVWLSATAGVNPGSTNKYQGLQVTLFNATVAGLTNAVVDSTPPTITRIGSSSVSVALNGTYTDAGASASDLVDGIVNVITTNPVNTAVAGIYTVTYNAADASGNNATPVTRSVTVEGPAGFSGWITGFGLAAGQQGGSADPDKDGISNLLEYAIDGQNPTVPNSTIGTFTGNLLSFAKRADATGLTYAIEVSDDLGVADAWAVVTPNSNTAAAITYQLPAGSAKSFARLKVTN